MTRQNRRRLIVVAVAAAVGATSPLWGPRILRTVPAFYAADIEGTRALLGFLLLDCCGGRPELCAPLPAHACCPPARSTP